MAILAIVSGGAIAYVTSSFTIRSVGMILLIFGVYLGRLARGTAQTDLVTAPTAASNRPGPVLWAVAIALSLAAAVAFYYLYKDALQGYHQTVPVYAFAGIALICGLVWAALLARLVR
jgi:uncharacterized membrane protein